MPLNASALSRANSSPIVRALRCHPGRSRGRSHRVGSPAPEIHDSVLHTLEGELDLEEMTTRCYTTEAG
jgi:hypothetical protein